MSLPSTTIFPILAFTRFMLLFSKSVQTILRYSQKILSKQLDFSSVDYILGGKNNGKSNRKMNKFQRAAQKVGSLSPLMEGRSQIMTGDLKGKTVTIMAFDLPKYQYQSGEEKRIPVLVFKEYKSKYYFGNPMMYDLCKAWADLYDGDIEEASAELAECGGFQLHF